MGCLRLFRRLRRRSSEQDDALLTSQQGLSPRPYRDHESKHQHSPSADSSFSTDFAEKVSYSEKSRYRGSSRAGSVAVPVIRPNVNPAYSAYATPEVYRYGGAGPRDDAYARARAAAAAVNAEKKEVDVDSPEEKDRRRKAEEQEQERMDFLQMM
ncbi:hypothetical protein QBC32DRAFT_355358 [Pseudoneurospora amorphoporcata]|uniref:Uncharacterized protein n=1 Tax=Pseudoneurospora amorphoporcata TaxID=241081 RepID=A0AAN6NLQ1_9PEZI|nr:hypothetical protein QBC32DRAFT_355358 [Pseudoneurospora amorphoporcata]